MSSIHQHYNGHCTTSMDVCFHCGSSVHTDVFVPSPTLMFSLEDVLIISMLSLIKPIERKCLRALFSLEDIGKSKSQDRKALQRPVRSGEHTWWGKTSSPGDARSGPIGSWNIPATKAMDCSFCYGQGKDTAKDRDSGGASSFHKSSTSWMTNV